MNTHAQYKPLACMKVKLWDLTVCIAINGEKF